MQPVLTLDYDHDKYIHSEINKVSKAVEGGGDTVDRNRAAKALLPLTPATFHILISIGDGERHGYSIMREIAERTNGEFRIGPATLYRSIERMLADGLIEELEERPEPDSDERRRYYRVTDFGQQVARAELERLEDLVEVARSTWGSGQGAHRELQPVLENLVGSARAAWNSG